MALAKPCKDHLGNEFKSKAALCRHYGISTELFTQRQLKGMSLEDSLKQQEFRLGQEKNAKTI